MMKNIINPHDRYFRAAMSEPEVARDFFESYLPAEIKNCIDLKSLKLCKESFIDEKLHLQITDLLFSVNFSEQPGYLYLLTEHQSTGDFFMPLRLWKYMVAIMEQHIAESKEKILPIVYPMIYYNGHISYKYSTEFFDLFGQYKNLAKSILLQPFHLIDLTKITDEELRQHQWVGIMGFVMKYIFARDILPYIKATIPLLKQVEKMNANRYIETTFSYLLQTGEISNKKTVIETFMQELSPKTGERLMTLGEWFKEEGRVEGMQQGMQQGICEAKKSVALKLLKMGLSLETIIQATELTNEEIRALESV